MRACVLVLFVQLKNSTVLQLKNSTVEILIGLLFFFIDAKTRSIQAHIIGQVHGPYIVKCTSPIICALILCVFEPMKKNQYKHNQNFAPCTICTRSYANFKGKIL